MQWRKDICSGPVRCTAGQITPIYPDLPRADPSQILPGGTWVCYMCLHVDSIFNKNVIIIISVLNKPSLRPELSLSSPGPSSLTSMLPPFKPAQYSREKRKDLLRCQIIFMCVESRARGTCPSLKRFKRTFFCDFHATCVRFALFGVRFCTIWS